MNPFPYAPFPLEQAQRAGLLSAILETPLGPVRVHHSPTRSGDVATVLLHGAAGSWTTWTPLLRAASDADAPLRDVVAIDLPGWAGSPGPSIRSRLTLDSLAAVVWQIVLDRLGYERLDITGHSLGGFIALHLAATRPECVVAVRLVSATTSAVLCGARHPIGTFRAVPGFAMLLGVFRMLRMLGSAESGTVRLVRRAGLLPLAVAPLFRHTRRVPRSVIDALADEVRPDSFVRAVQQVDGYPVESMWSAIRCAVWAIRGDSDIFVPRSDLTDLLRWIPEATLAEVADCGHFAHIERPYETLLGLGFSNDRPAPHAKAPPTEDRVDGA
jgi:pimeloyl-ACP methyl ester carboxylesterase